MGPEPTGPVIGHTFPLLNWLGISETLITLFQVFPGSLPCQSAGPQGPAHRLSQELTVIDHFLSLSHFLSALHLNHFILRILL